MGKAKILVVDDDEALAEMIGIVLRNDGFEPTFAADGTSALPAFHRERPDLVLLDLMLPGIDGIEVCRLIRAESDVPIVMLTAKSDTADVVRGLESGADDYVPKPFKPAELVARVRARLREGEAKPAEVLHIGDLEIDVAGHEVTRGGVGIALGGRAIARRHFEAEFGLLHPGDAPGQSKAQTETEAAERRPPQKPDRLPQCLKTMQRCTCRHLLARLK